MLTVTEPAETFNLIDLETARAVLGIPGEGEDLALEGMIARASDVIARHCNRVFGLETVTETIRLDQHLDDLILSRYPVVEIASILENGTVLPETAYEVNLDSGIVTRLDGDRPTWWWSCKIVVTYTAGLELPDETPEALKQACLQLVKSYRLGSDRDPMVRSQSVLEGMYSASYFGEADLPPDLVGLLGKFRNRRMR